MFKTLFNKIKSLFIKEVPISTDTDTYGLRYFLDNDPLSFIMEEFIREMEGNSLVGYVPNSGKSGVTIGAGFDLGQWTEEQIKGILLPPWSDCGGNKELFDKLKPYFGLKQVAAKQKLEKIPLTCNENEVAFLNDIILEKVVRGIIEEIGEDLWLSLSSPLRTVLTSVQYQYGNCKVRTPKFYSAVLEKDIPKVIEILENFGDKYPTRRKKEAELLKRSI